MINLKKTKFVLFTFFITPILASCGSSKEESALNKMEKAYLDNVYITDAERIKPYENRTGYDIITQELNRQVINNETTYYFNDIDYTKDDDRAIWPALGHLNKMKYIAMVGVRDNKKDLIDVAAKLGYYWVYNNFVNVNWFNNDVGAGNCLTIYGMLMKNYMHSKGWSALLGKTRRVSFKYNPSLLSHTGANLCNYADLTMRSAIIDNDEEEFNLAFTRIQQELSYDVVESFQPDGSFFQHGRLLQAGGYGVNAVQTLSKVASIVYKAGLKFDEERLNVISNYILNGLRLYTHKGSLSYFCNGRYYSRPNNLNVSSIGIASLKPLLEIDNMPHKEEIRQYIDNALNNKTTFEGLHTQDVANVIALQKDGIYIGFKGINGKLIGTECVNNENVLGVGLTVGYNTCVMENGKEYDNITKYWDYSYIPGSVSVDFNGENHNKIKLLDQDEVIKEYVSKKMTPTMNELLPITPVGGQENLFNFVSPSAVNYNTACSMMFAAPHVNACYKTCFATDDGLVMVGSSCGAGDQDDYGNNCHITLEDCLCDESKNPSLYDDNYTFTNGNVVYSSLNVTSPNNGKKQRELIYEKQSVEGSFHRNNLNYSEAADSKNILKLSMSIIEEGDGSPFNGSYAYSIQPESCYDTNKFKTLCTGAYSNGDADIFVHAIKTTGLGDDLVMVAFYDDGEFKFTDENGEHSIKGNRGDYIVKKMSEL